ncbi:DDE-type integrase/transposase/recombinase [Pirellulaceae bacterium SH501]
MIAPKRRQNSYDHRLRELVFQSGRTETARRIGVPRSTIHGWTKARPRPVVTLIAKGDYVESLEKRVYLLERRTARLRALLRLCVVLLRLSGFSLTYQRLPQGSDKEKLLRVIDRASRFVRLPRLLAYIGLSSSRYYDWKNSQDCGLDDVSSCPRSLPGQMTATERSEMRSMVQSEDYRHLSVGSIARLAARVGKVYACTSTWYRAIQNGNWIRSRKRIYPPKPRIGLRATKPNEYWHVDTTIVRLLDGSRVYLHAILDNFSRRILAWRLNDTFETDTTAELLKEAAKGHPENTVPSAVMDSGVENVNGTVNELVSDGTIQRILAQVDIVESNSMIEAWWRQLKHQWLYLNELDSESSVRKLIAFYVEQHNSVVPHFAFQGQTPDEMYFGTGAKVPVDLKEKRATARAARISHNRALSCDRCKARESEPALVSIQNNTS